MNLTAFRNKAFEEIFTFKSADGRVIRPPAGVWSITVRNSGYVEVFDNLSILTAGVVWRIPATQVDALPYRTLYFTLNLNGAEVTRGVLRVK